MNKQELQDKIYSMSNSFLPLDVFFNDIRDNTADNYNKEQAYKDIEIIADFIIDLQSQLDQQKAMWKKLEKWITDKHNHSDNNDFLYTEILLKMQELEKGEKNEDKNE